jgi:hypothetical protein
MHCRNCNHVAARYLHVARRSLAHARDGLTSLQNGFFGCVAKKDDNVAAAKFFP